MSLRQVFYSPDGSRLRAGWRLALQVLMLLALASCLIVPLFLALILVDPAIAASLLQLRPQYLFLATLAQAVAVTVSVFLARRFLDRQSIESLGLKIDLQALVDVLAGIGIAFLQMALIYGVMHLAGWLTFEGFAWELDPMGVVAVNVLLFLLIFVLVGWSEELLSRGYHLQTLASGLNLFWGVILSSAIFSFLHLQNPSAGWLSTAGIFLAGIYLAFGYLRTRQLWLPIGLHIGWNFFQGVVFGFPVSGLDIYALARIRVHGPETWTGGAFGPEAGLIVLPALLAGVLLIYAYTVRRLR